MKYLRWILLSATPGDKYEDYIPVLVANGFYRNKTEFWDTHIIRNPYVNYPSVKGYILTGKINYHLSQILVKMKDPRKTTRINIRVTFEYDRNLYKQVWKERWDPYDNEPIKETGKLCYLLRRVVNSEKDRLYKIDEILSQFPKLIIFYNYDYELECLRSLGYGPDTIVAEWNGHKHDAIPKNEEWVYLVHSHNL